jgi:carboxypeptidase Taq
MNTEKLNELKDIIYEIDDVSKAAAILGWDQETYMPKGGIEDRSNQLSTLNKIAHEKFTSKRVGELINELKEDGKDLDPDSDTARLLKVLDRNYTKSVKVPAELVAEMSKASSIGMQTWSEAKQKSDFKIFEPKLKRIVDLKKQYAQLFQPYASIYDPLLDDFEPGLKTADVTEIFSSLREQQVNLIKEISEKPEIDNSFITREFDENGQWDIAVEAISVFGYNWDCGRQDKSAHPFTTTFGINDVRITTKINKNYFPSCFFGSLHEAGHGMYEQGINKSLARTPLASGASLSIHESQSRLWENLVGRSKSFWIYMYPKFQSKFPNQLKDVSLEKFYKGINKVKPSLIRIEADEATYNLHVMLRFEIEQSLIEGKVDVKSLPEIWNCKMLEYLGVKPTKDSEGVLQDIHWSMGAIGYFSTYALGNLVSAQLWECIEKDIKDIDKQISSGKFCELLSWLRKKIHDSGAKLDPQELVQKVTGSKINAEPYIRYLKNKFRDM